MGGHVAGTQQRLALRRGRRQRGVYVHAPVVDLRRRPQRAVRLIGVDGDNGRGRFQRRGADGQPGCITGKGYIVRTDPYVAVVGGVNMDIGAVSAGALVARDSNPGHVTTSLGGVGRNIAHNLCLLGQRTAMVTVMGNDDFGRRVQENAKDIGLDLSAGAVLPDCRTGTYLYICGPDGDMALAVNDMAVYDRMTPDFLRQRLDFINGADLVVLETNLPEESIRWLCDNCKAPILADPVSTIKAEKLRPVLGKLAALKPNRLEAELLSGMSIRTREDAAQAARKLLDTGLGTVFISLGAEGIYAADRSGDTAWVPCARCTVANATGGGDAVAAALAARMVRGDSLAETARWAVGAGALACEAETTINPAMSWDNIETILNRR